MKKLVLFMVAMTLVAAAGCVKKSIGVRSDPPGAAVFIDGLDVGVTPVERVPFDFYGTREIMVVKSGHIVERRLVEIDQPWFTYFPADIVSELLLPWNIQDRHHFYFKLEPAPPVAREVILRNAEQTRTIAIARIAGARERSSYKPRAYAVKDAEKRSIFWGPFFAPPRAEPEYSPLER